jgi:pseudaminic acid synthase
MVPSIVINHRRIGTGEPTYIIAEMSANHNQDLESAVNIIKAAKRSGADAIKLQTYTPDSLTIDCDNPYFKITDTIWQGQTLYELYSKAFTPWEWHVKLKEIAQDLNMDFFSTPFDAEAVQFLEGLEVPAFKIASFELVDHQLLQIVAKTGKPILISTGMASIGEIEEAVNVMTDAGNTAIALMKCTSAYPAPPEEMNLKTIPHLMAAFNVPIGLSDHSLGSAASIAAVALGACIIEKHFCLSRSEGGPDSAFSMEPNEFERMVKSIRIAEKAVGKVSYKVTEKQSSNRIFRRSIFVVRDMKKGEIFTQKSTRSIRPGHGLMPKYLNDILGKKASKDIKRGTPLDWSLVE